MQNSMPPSRVYERRQQRRRAHTPQPSGDGEVPSSQNRSGGE